LVPSLLLLPEKSTKLAQEKFHGIFSEASSGMLISKEYDKPNQKSAQRGKRSQKKKHFFS
jgi:hypothetical protein